MRMCLLVWARAQFKLVGLRSAPRGLAGIDDDNDLMRKVLTWTRALL